MMPAGAVSSIPAMSKFAIVAAIGIFLAWTLLAVAAYGLVDVLGGWLSTNSGVLLQGGKDVAGAVGVGKELVDKVDVQGTASLVQQVLAGALVIARPAIVALWLLGALAIVAAPFALRRMGLLRRSGQ